MKPNVWLTGLVDVLFPPACLSCGGIPEIAPDDVFCSRCRDELVFLDGSLCTVCGLPFPDSPAPDHLCANCIEKAPPYSIARSVFSYEGKILEAIHQFKYALNLAVGQALAGWMAKYPFRGLHPETFDLLIPVPLHIKRLRQRGFNQALILAKGLSGAYDVDINFRCLSRRRETLTQTGLTRNQRQENVRGAFALKSEKDVAGKRILLIDDVLTTGATIGECARLLLKAGAADVGAVTLARVADKPMI